MQIYLFKEMLINFGPGFDICNAGWCCIVNGLYIRVACHVCWMWTVLYRLEEAECEVYHQGAP